MNFERLAPIKVKWNNINKSEEIDLLKLLTINLSIMKKKYSSSTSPIKDVKRRTRRKFSAEEKIRATSSSRKDRSLAPTRPFVAIDRRCDHSRAENGIPAMPVMLPSENAKAANPPLR